VSNETLGIVVGGLVPAFLFAGSAVLQKVTTQSGIGLGFSLIFAGAMFAMGVTWALGVEKKGSGVILRNRRDFLDARCRWDYS